MGTLFSEVLSTPQTELEKFFNDVLDSYDGGIFITDARGIILFVAGASEYFLGMRPEELVGKPVQILIERGANPTPATITVLETGQPVMRYFMSKNGTKQFVVSRPVFKQDRLTLVVSYTLSVETLDRITQKLDEELNNYKQLTAYITEQSNSGQKIIAENAVMRSLFEMAAQIAATDSCILLLGESGTGKEVFAQYIHQHSNRKGLPFVPINCAAIPAELMESELFGYAPNAFTGASKSGKAGLFEIAEGGTIMLDEIGEMPLSMQAKLLRVLESGEFRRIGEQANRKSRARIIAATNRDLLEQVEKKNFRMDLYYRINILPIRIPPLRERREDILPLARYFLQIYNKKYHTNKMFGTETEQVMMQYPWPGNVRELRNIVERMVLVSPGHILLPGVFDLPLTLHAPESVESPFLNQSLYSLGLKEAVKKFEEEYLRRALERNGRNVVATAQHLQIPASTLYQKLRGYGIKTK